MRRPGRLIGRVIPAMVLLVAATAAGVEIAPLPHRALDTIGENPPAGPSGTEEGGQGQPSTPGGREGSAPGAQAAPPPGIVGTAPGSTPGAQAAPPPGSWGRRRAPPFPRLPFPPCRKIPRCRAPSPRCLRRRRRLPRRCRCRPPLLPPFRRCRPLCPPRPCLRGWRRPPPPPAAGFFVKFNNADLYEVIHTLGRTAGINYLIDPRVRGVVNVQTHGVLKKDAALDLLFSILKVNGATAIKEGDTYHIVPMSEAKTEPLIPSLSVDGAPRSSPNQVSMRAYPLQYISVAEMAKVIRPFLTPGGEAVEVGRANILLVIDTAANLEKTARLVELFDSEVFRAAGMKLFKLKVLDPEEMAKNLENIFGALDFSARGGKPSGINFVPIPRLYSLLVVSASPKTMEDVEKWIGELDRTGGGASRSVHRYRVKYGKVKDIAAVLERLYPEQDRSGRRRKEDGVQARGGPRLPGQASFPSQTPPAGPPGGAGAPAAARTAKGETEVSTQPFDIIPDEATNSLILRASLSEYADALEILKTVDVYPQQVLLEVLVGEVNLKDDLRLGIDWTWTGTGGGYNQTATLAPGSIPALNNFTYLIEKTGQADGGVPVAGGGRPGLGPLLPERHRDEREEVEDQRGGPDPHHDLGPEQRHEPAGDDHHRGVPRRGRHPHLHAVHQRPRAGDAGDRAGGERRQHHRPRGRIRPSSSGASRTNLVASQDQSIVLGGLVKERKSLDRSGLPWFYKIPVIGWIFGSRTDSVSRNELLIFITPRVIRSVEEGVQLSRDFEERVAQLKARMKETQGFRLKVQPVLPVPDPSSDHSAGERAAAAITGFRGATGTGRYLREEHAPGRPRFLAGRSGRTSGSRRSRTTGPPLPAGRGAPGTGSRAT